jgi:ankyrin repeat protein
MKIPRTYSQQVRIAALAVILPMLTAAGLRAGEIHTAAAAGDLNKVKALLDADPNLLESKNKEGETPLIKACIGAPPDNISQITTANFLIGKGANVNARGLSGRTPLIVSNDEMNARTINLARHLPARSCP